MTILVDDVCTDADLAIEVGGTELLLRMIPASWAGLATNARQSALDETMRALARRTPIIVDADLADVTELKGCVLYGALERLFRMAMTTPDSVHALQRKIYADRFQSEISGLMPTLNGDLRGAVFSIAFERR